MLTVGKLTLINSDTPVFVVRVYYSDELLQAYWGSQAQVQGVVYHR